MKLAIAAAAALGILLPSSAIAATVARTPKAVIADPPRDAAHPARNRQLLLESQGSKLNALFFLAQGPGPHPTLLLLHGLPGNERNLDLAQAVRRAGWNVLAFTYRGAWGSEGNFSIANSIEDSAAAMAFLRSPEAIREYGIDIDRLVVAGHSMGGFAAAWTAAREWKRTGKGVEGLGDPPLAGLILLDAWNIGATYGKVAAAGDKGRAAFETSLDDLGSALRGVTAGMLADELLRRGKGWDLREAAPLLAKVPILTVYATYGGAEDNRVLAAALRSSGARVSARELKTDHAFADHRIALAAEVVRWLEPLRR